MAKASKVSASDHVEAEGFEGHYAELGGTTVGFERYSADADMTPLFVGLPDDRCQCEHWGYVFEGKIVYHTTTETRSSWPAKRTSSDPDTPRRSSRAPRWSSSVPTDRLNETMEVVTKNMEASGA